MRGEVALAAKEGKNVPVVGGQTTSRLRPWLNEVDAISLEGLYGCTAVVVLSQRGVSIPESKSNRRAATNKE